MPIIDNWVGLAEDVVNSILNLPVTVLGETHQCEFKHNGNGRDNAPAGNGHWICGIEQSPTPFVRSLFTFVAVILSCII